MDSMDLVIKINKLKKRINGVHGLSMDSMDYGRIVQTLEKGNGVHGLHGF